MAGERLSIGARANPCSGPLSGAQADLDVYTHYKEFPSFRQAWCSNHFAWDLTPQYTEGYRGSLYSRQYDGILYSDIIFGALSGERKNIHIQLDDDFIGINLFVSGKERILQNYRDETVAAGELFLWDASQPTKFYTQAETRCLSIFVPSQIMEHRFPTFRSLLGRKIDTRRALGQLLISHLINIHRSIDDFPSEERTDALNLTLDMLASCFQPDIGKNGRSEHQLRTFRRITQYLDDVLFDEELTVGSCATEMGLSERYIRHIFSRFGISFSSYVRSRRLEKAAKALRSPGSTKVSITMIAMSHGFSDPAYFARAFSARYGMSPRTFRQLC